MKRDDHSQSPRVRVSADKTQAHLVVPAHCPPDQLTPEICHALVRDAGVEYTAAVENVVEALAAQPPQEAAEVLLAEATPPHHGRDGRVDWFIDDHDGDDGSANFYDRSAFVMVKAGQPLGRVTPPTPGEDGRDVTGRVIPAVPGKQAALSLNETIILDAQQQLIAQTDGQLVRNHDDARISQVLEVHEGVDFSTGNIDFPGDVIIHAHIRDCFHVRTPANVQVSGLIESATLDVGGNLICAGGMAGRQTGQLHVGGDLAARFLDGVIVNVRGDLRFEREIIGSQIVVHGRTDSPTGAIIGGLVVPVGPMHVGVLGSPACCGTCIAVGRVPRVQHALTQLHELANTVQQRHKQLCDEQAYLQLNSHRLNAPQRERMTEIIFEIEKFQSHLERLNAKIERLEEQFRRQRRVNITVERCLHQGVVIRTDCCQWQFMQDVPGPLTITSDMMGKLLVRRGNESPHPINDYARAA